MLILYIFALVVGGGLLTLSMLSIDGLLDGIDDAHDIGHNPVQWLSLRSLMYFLFVFGGVGLALTWTWPKATAPLVAALATGAGIVVGGLVTAAFRYLRKTESGYRPGDESFVGNAGRVTLPFGESGTGKVLVTRGDRTFELLARPFGDPPARPSVGDSVVVVEISRGVALIAPLDSSVNTLTSPDPS